MSTSLEDESDLTYTHFAHRDEFRQLIEPFLAIDISTEPSEAEDLQERHKVTFIGRILNYYLPLPGLLDPYLDEIVSPMMRLLAHHLNILAEAQGDPAPVSSRRLSRLGVVINWVVRVRGWKAVIPHFPSSISHLPVLISLLSPPSQPSSSSTPETPHHPYVSGQQSWELRSALLLWLALLLTVPFSLSALSPSEPAASTVIDLPASKRLFSTPTAELARKVVLLTLPVLDRPGKEGAFAGLVLARLFAREDCVQGLAGFLDWAAAELIEGERDAEANFIASILELLAVLPSLLASRHVPLLKDFMDDKLLPHLRGSRTAADSSLIRKLVIKAKGRWWTASLANGNGVNEELPDGIEEELDDLMSALGDKDTVVRYSSAKYLARITALLPASFSEQIVLATIALFSGTEDEPVLESPFGTIIDPGGNAVGTGMGFGGIETTRGEARWHGVCLALAEMARRGLLAGEAIGEAVNWVLKALTFDLRRASHSIGANVRDAAAYVVWSLSRACSPNAFRSFAPGIATALVCVACFDREVGVRRAASAAYQEGVGRLGLYPEGIDVLGKTDFYSVSIRRMAFTAAAPAVAVHEVYRTALRNHLHNITLRHWDIAMRTLGATTLRSLLELSELADLEESINREINELSSLDSTSVHGALVSLGQVAGLLKDDDDRRMKIMLALSSVRPSIFVSIGAAEILQAACGLLTACLSPSSAGETKLQKILDHIIEASMRRREPECQEALSRTFGRLSELRDCTKDVEKLLGDLRSARAGQKQAATLALGSIRYAQCPSTVEKAVKALLGLMDPIAKSDVETRRYAIRSLSDIVRQTSPEGILLVQTTKFHSIFSAFIASLADYSTDQRGDVGSWIRIVGLAALGDTIAFTAEQQPDERLSLISQDQFEEAVEGIVKQAVEKLEVVRAEAAAALAKMRQAGANEAWEWSGIDALSLDCNPGVDHLERFRHLEPRDWYASAMPLLETKYRRGLISGLVQTAGSPAESIATLATQPLIDYLSKDGKFLIDVLRDLQNLLAASISANRVFIPSVTTAQHLVAADQLGWREWNVVRDDICSKILALACRSIGQIKSIERLIATMKLVVAALVANTQLKVTAIKHLQLFLAHRFPRIRVLSAEHLYLVLSEAEDEIDPELEDVLLETSWIDENVGSEEAETVVRLLEQQVYYDKLRADRRNGRLLAT
ncbi:armadillo-type protein [Naematelia encephala]|uniref:Armadillo-type protein n=1 Tax=Naematelia encephala TaxID=71784 RepID=A0A1Y2ARJ2_9TREE|nr:armadillo-type protein [Naematelia encephala]